MKLCGVICTNTLCNEDDDDNSSNAVRRQTSKKQEIADIIENTSENFLEARKSLFEKQASILQLQFHLYDEIQK
jgi:hypothetical protein